MTGATDTIGKIVVLTVLECDLGIIAGSMPMLRHLFRNLALSYGASEGTPGKSRDINLVTIGGTGGRNHIKLSNNGTSRMGDDKESNGDDESTRHIIHITREVEQDSVSDRGVSARQFHVTISERGGLGHKFDVEGPRYI